MPDHYPAVDLTTAREVLRSLGLTDADLSAIAKRGSISSESRSRNSIVYKLRWRADGRQRSRYLGVDGEYVAEIKQAVVALQNWRAVKSRLRDQQRDAVRRLRELRRQLAPSLSQHGFYFHGAAIRKRRQIDVHEQGGSP